MLFTNICDVAEGIPVDSQHLVNLVCCTQLLLREIQKCKLLVMAHPMDMTSFYERRPRSSGVAVLDKLILWRPPLHDYHQEELISIQRDYEAVKRHVERNVGLHASRSR
ncbi:regulator of G-protein signaling 7-binding protein A, partial [Trichonephila clavata]